MASTTTRTEARTASNLRQIATLRTRRDEIAANWTAYGYDRTSEMCDAIGEQIQALYEEIDAIEEGTTTQAGRLESATGRDDEVAITPAVRETMANYGWTVEDYTRNQRKLAARRAAGR